MPTYQELLERWGSERTTTAATPQPSAGASDGSYNALLDTWAADEQRRLKGSLDVASRAPDTTGEVARLARQTGLPAASVEADKAEVARRQRLREIAQQDLLNSSPILARQLQDPAFAKLALDDTENLSALERAIRAVGVPARELTSGLAQFNAGALGVGEGAAKFLAQEVADTAAYFEVLAGKREAPADGGFAQGEVDPSSPLAQVGAFFEARRRGQQQIADYIAGELPADAGPIRRGVRAGLQSVGSQGPALAATILTRNPSYALGGGAITAGGLSTAEALDQGLSPGDALGFGARDAMAEVITERLPVSSLLKGLDSADSLPAIFGRQLLVENIGEQAATFLQDLNAWATLNPEGTLNDFLRERPERALETAVAATVGTSVQTGAVFLLDRERQANTAEAQARRLDELQQVAEANKVLQRDAESFQRFAQEVAGDGPIQDVYLDARLLAEGDTAQKLAEIVPSIAAELPNAIASGGTIRIPLGEYASRVATSELAQLLNDHARVGDPNAMSRVEAQKFLQEKVESLEAEVKGVLDAKDDDLDFRKSYNEVRGAVRDRLNELGAFAPSVNEYYATLQASYAASRGAALGRLPTDVFNEYLLSVESSRATEADRFAQQDFRTSLPTIQPGDAVDGRTVRDEVPNLESIAASIPNADVLPGVREITVADLDPEFVRGVQSRPLDERTQRLADEIRESGEITPLIMVYDGESPYPYVLEGSHRIDALVASGARSFPAVVVIDADNPPTGNQGRVAQLQSSAERGTRKVIKKAELSSEERAAATASAEENGVPVREVLATIRRHKAAHPASQGWAPLTFRRLIVKKSESGKTKIEYKYDVVPYTFASDSSAKRIRAVASAMVDEVVAVRDRADNGLGQDKESAQTILTHASWYESMRSRLRREFGGFGDLFTDLLGATSPNTPVRDNWTNALESMRLAMRGEFDGFMPMWEAWADRVDQLEMDLRGWFNQQQETGQTKAAIKSSPEYQQRLEDLRRARALPEALIPKKAIGSKFGFNGRNIVRTMVDLWRVVKAADPDIARGPTAPKALNFSGNLIGFRRGATIDVWAARMLQRLSGGKRIPSMAEGGVTGAMLPSGETTMQFGFGQDVFAAAVQQLATDPRTRDDARINALGADDLQALVWFIEKEVWTKNDWTNQAGEGGSFELEAQLTGSAEQARIRRLRSRSTSRAKGTTDAARAAAARELAELERSVDRFVGGLSTQMSVDYQGVNYVPTDSDMAQLGAALRLAIYEADDGATVLGSKALSTEGRYGGVERSIDLEVVTRENFDPSALWAEMVRTAQQYQQDSTFLSRVLRDDEEVDPLRHRPGVELFFSESVKPGDLEAVIADLNAQGVEFFTVITDARRSSSAISGAMPNAVGVRMQYVPEFFETEAQRLATLDDTALAAHIQSQYEQMHDMAIRLTSVLPSIGSANALWYETRVAFSGQYEDILHADTKRAASGDDQQAGGRAGWRGQSVREGLAGAAKQFEFREAEQRRADETSARGAAETDGPVDETAATGAQTGGLPDGGGIPGAPGVLAQSDRPDTGDAGREADGSLAGLPRDVGGFQASAWATGQRVAAEYMAAAGLPYNPPTRYAKVNTARAKRIADAFEAMAHDPQNPEVKAAYAAMIQETAAQYRAALAAGLQVEFITGEDPYAGNPRNMTEDVRNNNHMWVFSTRDGFGTDATFDPLDNPLLAETEFEISGQRALANDLFRVVHDYFGHVMEGVGFRAIGEENAWQAHMAMYSPLARRAATTETRGQNSWLNYGPFGETNRTAKVEDTHFADQKVGLLPEWAVTEGYLGQDTDSAQDQRSLQQELQSGSNRGEYTPTSRMISLLAKADLSTFLHESAHYFFDTDLQIARGILERRKLAEVLPDEPLADPEEQKAADRRKAAIAKGEQQILDDVSAILTWHGYEGDIESQLIAWGDLDFESQRVAHERFAEAFEAYLFEGKAPSVSLEPAFRAFRSFLTRVYDSLQQFFARYPEAGKLDDTVRGVFDRMLATQQQITYAEQTRSLAGMFSPEEAANLGVDPDAYQELLVASTAAGVEYLQARGLRDMRFIARTRSKELRRLKAEMADRRKAVEAEVRAEVEQMPVYRLIRYIKNGELDEGPRTNAQRKALDRLGGMSTKLDIAPLREMYGDHPAAIWRYIPSFVSRDGSPPELLADAFKYASVDAMVRELASAAPMREVVEARTDERMLELYGELTTPEGLEVEVDKAVHNAVRARLITTELNALERAAGSSGVLAGAARRVAANHVRNVRLKDLRPKSFTAAAARAAKASMEALKAGDLVTAAREKRRQLFHTLAAQEAYEAVARGVTARQWFTRVIRAPDDRLKGRNQDVVAAIRAVLSGYGYGGKAEQANEYLQLVARYDPPTAQALAELANEIATAVPPAPLEQLTVEQLDGLYGHLRDMWRISRRAQQIVVDGKLRDREEVAAELTGAIVDLVGPITEAQRVTGVTPAEERALNFASFRAALTRVEAWVRAIDGAQTKQGLFTRLIFNPIKDAADAYRAEKAARLRALRALIEPISPTMRRGLIAAPELNYTFGGDTGGVGLNELLHAILHTGNDSNKRKLLLGRGWGEETEDGTLITTRWDAFIQRMVDEGVLRREHFEFAQGVWNLNEEMKVDAQRVHRDVYGRYFAEVTANPFEISFGGDVVKYAGGYVPAMTDARLVDDKALFEAIEEDRDSMVHVFPHAPKGFTMSRNEAYNRPLMLDLRTLPQHINKVLLFIHMEIPTRDVAKLLDDRGLKKAINHLDPRAIRDLLKPWLVRSALQQVTTPVPGYSWMAQLANTLRNRTGMATMMGNVSNTAQQITGLVLAVVRVKPRSLISVLAQWIKNPRELARSIAAASSYMSQRMDNEVAAMTDQIQEIVLNPSVYESMQQWTERHSYFTQVAFDNVLSPIIWQAAYNESREEGLDHEPARRHADSVVRTTQGSSLAEDVSRIEVQNAFIRPVMQFAGWFNMQANLMGAEFGSMMLRGGVRRNMMRGATVVMLGFYVQAAITEAIAQLFRGGPPDEDDDGEYLDDWLAATLVIGPLRNLTAMVPVLGQVANTAVAMSNDSPTDDRLTFAPIVSQIEGALRGTGVIAKSTMAIFTGEEVEGKPRDIKDVATLISLTTGLPATVIARPASYAAGVDSGRIDPEGPVDVARGLVTGTASPESRTYQ